MKMQLHCTAVTVALQLALVAMLMAIAQPARAADSGQSAANVTRPKICLVLSGGGARGAAHVGVLKVLEEYRVPIHCIAGTSMGALVGASYATGTSVAEMEKINGEISTELLLKEDPPRNELSMRRKADDYKPFVGPELGIRDGGLHFPKGVVTGVQLESVLRRLSKTKGYHQFDDLPIPFRAVATDLVTGKAVVFREGELANVMRASMSVPGAVAPAEFNGMILVDGMLTDNMPVDIARAMGADIVIAVNVGTPLLTREELTGITGITGQMLSILTEQNVQVAIASLKPTDILISPELGDYSTADFDHLTQIAPLGEVAARKVAERLRQLAIPAAEYAALRQRQLVAVIPDTRPVAEIRFNNLQRVNPQAAQEVMRTQPGQPIDQATLDADMRRLYGTGDFEHLNYRFLEEPGRRILVVDAVEKLWGPNYIRFGIGLSSDFSGDAFFNILSSYRRTWLNSLGAEWRTDLQVGHTSSLRSEFYQPLNPEGRFFVAPNAGIERRSINLYQGSTRIASFDVDSAFAGLDAGIQLRQFGVARLGIQGGALKPKHDTGPPSLLPDESRIAQGAYTARVLLDQLDSVHFPRSGWRFSANVYKSSSNLGADAPYTKWDTDGGAVYSIGDHTFNFTAKLGGKMGSDPLPPYDQFQWGGFLQQSGYTTGQLIGQTLRFGRIMYYHRVLRGSIFEGAYAGISLEAGKVGIPLVPGNPEGLLKSASIFGAADSPIGPVYLGYGHAADGNSSFYFYVGRPF